VKTPELKAMFVTTLLLASLQGLSGSDNAQRSVLAFPAGLYIVKAKAISASKPENTLLRGQYCTFEVQRVYVGDARLKGRLFDLTNYVNPPSGTVKNFERTLAHGFIDEIKVGEEGIWPLTREDGILVVQTDIKLLAHQGLWWFPFRNTPSTGFSYEHTKNRYSAGHAWARAVQDLWEAKNEASRTEVLRKYARAKDSPISGWAIYNLAKMEDSKDVTDFLESLAVRRDLSVLGQTVLDKVLSDRRGRTWDESAARNTLLAKWLTTSLPHADHYRALANFVVDPRLERLTQAVQGDQRELLRVIRLLEPLLLKKADLPEGRARELGVFLDMLKPATLMEKRALFSFLIRVIRESPLPEARENAARGVSHCFPLGNEQRGILKTVAGATSDEKVVKLLEALLILGALR
jgi:hypothetical protein